MSVTYKLNNFSMIANVPIEDSVKILHNDTWFPSKSVRYVKFVIQDNSIVFIDRQNVQKDGYVMIDNTINPTEINLDKELTMNQLASVVFSVNGNKNVYNYLKSFIREIKSNSNDYCACISNRSMKTFAAHLAYLHSVIGHDEKIADWIYQDPLFSEIVVQFEMINQRKMTKYDIPSLSSGMEIYSKIMYLSFLMVRDKVWANQNTDDDKYKQILKGMTLDVKKFNDALTFE